jgi:metal-dependent hydrolase (beta-lactamase superfamily II)
VQAYTSINRRVDLINLSHHHFDKLIKVYAKWILNNKIRIIYVGKDNFSDKLIEMKSDKKMQKYSPDLFVTWAAAPFNLLVGLESFLCAELYPEIFSISNTF